MLNALLTQLLPNQDVAAGGASSLIPAGTEPEAAQPFQTLLAEQLQAIRLLPSAGGLFGSESGFGALGEGQGLAGHGLGLPGLLGASGLTIESVTYSRITIGDGSALEGLGAEAPGAEGLEGESSDLNAILQALAAPETGAQEEALTAVLPEAELAEVAAAPAALSTAEPAADDVFADPSLGQKIGNSVASIANTGSPGANFAVDHPDYGRVEARVKVGEDGAVELSFGSQDANLRDTLEGARGDIESALRDSGFVLAEFSVVDTGEAGSLIADSALEGSDALVTGLDATLPFTQLDSNLSRAISLEALDLIQS